MAGTATIFENHILKAIDLVDERRLTYATVTAAQKNLWTTDVQPSVTSVYIPEHSKLLFVIDGKTFGTYTQGLQTQTLYSDEKLDIVIVAQVDDTGKVTLRFQKSLVKPIVLQPYDVEPEAVYLAQGVEAITFKPAKSCVPPHKSLHDTVARIIRNSKHEILPEVPSHALAKRVDPEQNYLLYDVETCAFKPEWYVAACKGDFECERILSQAALQTVQLDGGYSFKSILRGAFPLEWRNVIAAHDALSIALSFMALMQFMKVNRLYHHDFHWGNIVVQFKYDAAKPVHLVRLIDLSLSEFTPHEGVGLDPYQAHFEKMYSEAEDLCKKLVGYFERHGKFIKILDPMDLGFIDIRERNHVDHAIFTELLIQGHLQAIKYQIVKVLADDVPIIVPNTDYCTSLSQKDAWAGSIETEHVMLCVLDVALLLKNPLFERTYASRVTAHNMILWPYERRIMIDPLGSRVEPSVHHLVLAFNYVCPETLHVPEDVKTLDAFIAAAQTRIMQAKRLKSSH